MSKVAPTPTVLCPSASALDILEAHTRAPAEAAERAVETLRESLATYLTRAAACRQRLEALRVQHGPELARLAGLDYGRLHLQIGGGTGLAQQLRHAVDEVRTVFEGRADEGGTVPSVLTILDGMPGRVARLTAADMHACPRGPRGGMFCGCVVGSLRTTVENCEVFPTWIPPRMAVIADLTQRLTHALAARGTGVEVLTGTREPPVDRRPSSSALTEFDVLP